MCCRNTVQQNLTTNPVYKCGNNNGLEQNMVFIKIMKQFLKYFDINYK